MRLGFGFINEFDVVAILVLKTQSSFKEFEGKNIYHNMHSILSISVFQSFLRKDSCDTNAYLIRLQVVNLIGHIIKVVVVKSTNEYFDTFRLKSTSTFKMC